MAWKRVKANRGSAGVDGLTIPETVEHRKTPTGPRFGIGCATVVTLATAGAPSADTEVRGRQAGIGDTDRDGSSDPASSAANPAAVE